MLRRVIEAGAKNLSAEPMRQLLAEMRVPKEALLQLLTQTLVSTLEETRESVYRSVSRELKALMERTNISDEIAAALSQLSVEVTMQVRFSPREAERPSDSSAPPPSSRASDSSAPGVVWNTAAGQASAKARSKEPLPKKGGSRLEGAVAPTGAEAGEPPSSGSTASSSSPEKSTT